MKFTSIIALAVATFGSVNARVVRPDRLLALNENSFQCSSEGGWCGLSGWGCCSGFVCVDIDLNGGHCTKALTRQDPAANVCGGEGSWCGLSGWGCCDGFRCVDIDLNGGHCTSAFAPKASC